jgi:hypothetical protein
VIGPKKLSVIRQELRLALTPASGGDPLEWLERRMTAPSVESPAEENEVLHSLRRVLEAKRTRQRRKHASAVGKRLSR